MKNTFEIKGQVVDVVARRIYSGVIYVHKGIIERIEESTQEHGPYILPGFIDAHVHIESSMLTPSQFARFAVVHGTVGTISDPHEIGNVLGVEGVQYMIDNGNQVPFKFYFGAPSCVPATTFETAGATITAADIEVLFKQKNIKYLAEMMNWPGVLYQDPDVMAKIALAQQYNKPVDGHAPGLKGELARNYIAAGISTDHECFTAEEALDKLNAGMKILIREGSAAKNFEALIELMHEHGEQMMFCSDDKHPDSLVAGHINELVKRAVARGIDVFKVLQAACVNPVKHYGLEVGLLQAGDPADFILVNNLTDFAILQTYIDGEMVAEKGDSYVPSLPSKIVNHFTASKKAPEAFAVPTKGGQLRVMEALDGQLITNALFFPPTIVNGYVESDTNSDILKLAVVNRYTDAPPVVAFIKNFGLKKGAIASSVAHDSHNIIAVGVDNESIARAVNALIEVKGGIAVVDGDIHEVLPLPIAGLMTGEDGYAVARQYEQLDKLAKAMGSTLQSPFMTLSFMALLVIPSLKLSDKGLFDGDKFVFTPVWA
ncbi:adenine deaminase [Rhodocytophaga aerolata]|uniref:Adenine deaminase n=1 Tax=Rhodocytophaga aerolata TaxID=455078 RepID=A0ABT8RHA5_9BACT|nr:adenine deaminase [Rhodocytophaga aerolata]MDO1450072.1 adenine deaminase [Rhodocytophaga aerolata]